MYANYRQQLEASVECIWVQHSLKLAPQATAKSVFNDYFRTRGRKATTVSLYSQLLTKSDAGI